MNETTLQELKTALEKEHELLITELKSIATPDPVKKDEWNVVFPKFEEHETGSHASLEEEADEVEEYELRLATEESLESRLLAVNHALSAMQNQTYGICVKCKKQIPVERLKANPSALFHVEHAP